MNKGALWNLIQVAAEICVDNFSMASVNQLVDVFHRVQCAAVLPIGRTVLTADRSRKSGRPLFPVRFGYVYPPHGQWLIGSAFQLLRQFVQPSFHAVRLYVLEG